MPFRGPTFVPACVMPTRTAQRKVVRRRLRKSMVLPGIRGLSGGLLSGEPFRLNREDTVSVISFGCRREDYDGCEFAGGTWFYAYIARLHPNDCQCYLGARLVCRCPGVPSAAQDWPLVRLPLPDTSSSPPALAPGTLRRPSTDRAIGDDSKILPDERGIGRRTVMMTFPFGWLTKAPRWPAEEHGR